MGWTYQHRERGITDRAFFQREFPSVTILECATVRGTFYAAVRPQNTGKIFALVCLTQRAPKSQYNYGYKDMDESVGPCESAAPAKVLDALTDPPYNTSASEWRARCRAMIAKPTPVEGDTVILEAPMNFGGIPESRLHKVSLRGYKNVYRTDSGRLVRFTRLKNYAYTIQPRVAA